MITAGRPSEVMKHLWDVLAGMGVDIHVEGDFKYRCTRPAKRTGRERDRREISGDSRNKPAEQSAVAIPASPTPQPPRPDATPATEVRFSVELTRLDRLKDMYSVDIRRMKGNLKSYKFLYDTLRGYVFPTVLLLLS
ncbi:hypothetical protein C8F01DRAFT_1306950 [Mycena amicta]|nr:hypothetical protein C8F01DRAFT_1306950 [Mycena amicta]